MRKEDIENAIEGIMKSLTRSAKLRFKNRYDDIRQELDKFKEKMKADLLRYTKALANQELTKEQFKQLVDDNLRLAEMKSLTQAGISIVEIDKYREAALKKIIGVVFKVILPALL